MSIALQHRSLPHCTAFLLFLAASGCASTDHADRLAEYDLLESERLRDLTQESTTQQADRERAFSGLLSEPVQDGVAIVSAVPGREPVTRSSLKDSSSITAVQNDAISRSAKTVSEELQRTAERPGFGTTSGTPDYNDAYKPSDRTSLQGDHANNTRNPYSSAFSASPESSEPLRAQWETGRIANPVTGLEECAISSLPRIVQNGGLRTEARVFITGNRLYLRTDATLDLSPVQSGLRIDAGLPIRFDRLLNELTAVLDTQHAQIMEKLEQGTVLTINFAYQPHLGDFDTHTIEYVLDEFPGARYALSSCLASASVISDLQAVG